MYATERDVAPPDGSASPIGIDVLDDLAQTRPRTLIVSPPVV
jgi:hypothetical protein